MTDNPTAHVATGPFLLRGGMQHYAWGDSAFLPRLLGLTGADKPYAELWLGDHPLLPSVVLSDEGEVPLTEFFAAAGAEPARPVAGLPYLLKILSAARPLSIQVHPSQAQARLGYARENEAGLALGARERTYRDPNHKPELLVALTPMATLAGFRPASSLLETLAWVPEVMALLPPLEGASAGLRQWLRAYFALPEQSLSAAWELALTRLRAEVAAQELDEHDPRHWAVVADQELRGDGRSGRPPDRGLLFVFVLNLRLLSPGEGLFVPAGMPHAYLRGSGVELMANSDNVVRCGLTEKFVDAEALLNIVEFRGAAPPVLAAQKTLLGDEWGYRTPAGEFELRRLQLPVDSARDRVASGPELLLALPLHEGATADGEALYAVQGPAGEVMLGAGACCLLLPGAAYRLRCLRPCQLFRVTQPGAGGAQLFRGTEPRPLAFGTSGLRGLVADITDLEAYINTRGFLDYALSVGDVAARGRVAVACDLRPSSHSEERSILRAVLRAIADAGLSAQFLGRIPTPALTLHGLVEAIPSVMVTGSHIPFDRNGIKFNKSTGEVLKSDEPLILTCVNRVRGIEYGLPADQSSFGADGMFLSGRAPAVPAVDPQGMERYRQRYLNFFPPEALAGLRVLVYEHSAVGRELLADVLRALGAEVHAVGRSTGFVAIDTEALSPATVPTLQRFVDEASAAHGPVDAIVSTDGDSDRPLVLGVDAGGQVRFVSGDVLGILVAEYLEARSAAVPVSASDAIEQHLGPQSVTVARTRIGSPYVIDAMARLHGAGVVGWEANGGFLVGSAVRREGRALLPLPTRDAFLPICAVLHLACQRPGGIVGLLSTLPPRYTAAGLLDAVPVEDSRALVASISPASSVVTALSLRGGQVLVQQGTGTLRVAEAGLERELQEIVARLESVFSIARGFGSIMHMDFTDGVRVFFASGDIAHIRPSGNAPQLRIYAVADSAERARDIVDQALAEPDGLLRQALQLGREQHFVSAVRDNIALTEQLFVRGKPASVIGTVSGSAEAKAFWQALLDRSRESFRARAALSFHEDLPVNQAFGILLLWKRLAPELRPGEGALIAFVFGEGSRATPFTETDNGQKPALLSYVHDPVGRRPLSMVELSLRYFAPVESYLRRSGFDGVVIKWGDEVQIPTRDLAGTDPQLAEADVVRFVSLRRMTEQDAANKDWVGVNDLGEVTAFIPRRPLSEMAALADRGLLVRRSDGLWGGVNLGSIAVSRRLLSALLQEFEHEVLDPSAERKRRPDLDPQLFSALTLALLDDADERERALSLACDESPAVAKMMGFMPDVVARLRRVIETLQKDRPVKIRALDFEEQYWGDIGQHRQMFEFFMALNESGPTGEIARSLADLPPTRDASGNLLVGQCRLGAGVDVRNSVLIDVVVEEAGTIHDSVLVGTHARTVAAEEAFDMFSTVDHLKLARRGGSYRVVQAGTVDAKTGERVTTLFLPDGGVLMRVHEDTDLRDRERNYEQPILGNPMSFADAHAIMSAAGPQQVTERREACRKQVAAELDPQ